MILRYVSRVLVCKLHPSRVAQRPLFPVGRFNNKSTLSRPLFSSASAFSFPFLPSIPHPSPLFIFSFSLSPPFRSRRREKSFSRRGRKRVARYAAQSADYIVKYTRRRNYGTVDLYVGCLHYVRHFTAVSLNYGL